MFKTFTLDNSDVNVFFFPCLISEQRSILTDSDWKKLWMAGGVNPDSKVDNNVDSSDSPMFEDSEVSIFLLLFYFCDFYDDVGPHDFLALCGLEHSFPEMGVIFCESYLLMYFFLISTFL